jgi:hypothetical protein
LSLSDAALNQYQRNKVLVWQQTGRNLIPYSDGENVELPMTMAA